MTKEIVPTTWWIFFTNPVFLCCHQQTILPPSNGMAPGKKDDAVRSSTPAADTWTYGFDQFDRSCWGACFELITRDTEVSLLINLQA